MNSHHDWQGFYKKQEGREPRFVLLKAIELFDRPRRAIDLACGDGTDTLTLIQRGWHVLATDKEQSALDLTLAKIPNDLRPNLETQIASFENLVLPKVDLIHAGFSLPFCPPDHFDAMWAVIVESINTGGRFAGEFFGVHDTWADDPTMTFHTAEQVNKFLSPFEIEYYEEVDREGKASTGIKHWHVFHSVARKK